jgi:hypothetical protein
VVLSVAVHPAVSKGAVAVLMTVSPETPEWAGSARNMGQSVNVPLP